MVKDIKRAMQPCRLCLDRQSFKQSQTRRIRFTTVALRFTRTQLTQHSVLRNESRRGVIIPRSSVISRISDYDILTDSERERMKVGNRKLIPVQ